MKFLIAGFGSIGRRHFRNLLALNQNDILLYRTHSSRLPDDELESFDVESDLETALAHKPDAVIVSNPTALHLDVAIPAARAGCHLFLEKPISHSFDRVNELQDAVRSGGGKVFIGFQYRFHPGLQKVKKMLEDEEIGGVLSVRAHWGEYLPNWHPWEDYRQGYSARSDLGGGVILTLCHPLDYLLWLIGEVSALWSFSDYLGNLDLEVEDTAEIGLRFSNGVLGSVHLNYNQRPTSHHIEIIGTHGTIRWDNSDGTVHVFCSNSEKWESFPVPEGFQRNDLFLSEMRHFMEVVKGKKPPVCTLQEGIRVLELALAALSSNDQVKLIQWN